MKWSPTELKKLDSIDEFVALSIEKKYLADVHDGYYEHDTWHTPFAWLMAKEDDGITIRIVSSGTNRVFENGEGDDLSVAIHFDGSGISKMALHPKR